MENNEILDQVEWVKNFRADSDFDNFSAIFAHNSHAFKPHLRVKRQESATESPSSGGARNNFDSKEVIQAFEENITPLLTWTMIIFLLVCITLPLLFYIEDKFLKEWNKKVNPEENENKEEESGEAKADIANNNIEDMVDPNEGPSLIQVDPNDFPKYKEEFVRYVNRDTQIDVSDDEDLLEYGLMEGGQIKTPSVPALKAMQLSNYAVKSKPSYRVVGPVEPIASIPYLKEKPDASKSKPQLIADRAPSSQILCQEQTCNANSRVQIQEEPDVTYSYRRAVPVEPIASVPYFGEKNDMAGSKPQLISDPAQSSSRVECSKCEEQQTQTIITSNASSRSRFTCPEQEEPVLTYNYKRTSSSTVGPAASVSVPYLKDDEMPGGQKPPTSANANSNPK